MNGCINVAVDKDIDKNRYGHSYGYHSDRYRYWCGYGCRYAYGCRYIGLTRIDMRMDVDT